MEPEKIALAGARARMGFGVAFMLLPGVAGERLWIGSVARERPVKLVLRALGARDLALGLGTAIAIDRGSPVRGWLEAGALADAADALATLLAGRSISPSARLAVLALGGGSAVAGALLARKLDESPPGGEANVPEAALTGHPPA